MFSKVFWKDTFERVVSTAAQAAIGVLVVDGATITNIDWEAGAGIVGTAALVSLLKALVAGKVGGDVSPASLASEGK